MREGEKRELNIWHSVFVLTADCCLLSLVLEWDPKAVNRYGNSFVSYAMMKRNRQTPFDNYQLFLRVSRPALECVNIPTINFGGKILPTRRNNISLFTLGEFTGSFLGGWGKTVSLSQFFYLCHSSFYHGVRIDQSSYSCQSATCCFTFPRSQQM